MKKILSFATILFLTFEATGCSLLTVRHEPKDIIISNEKREDLDGSKTIKEKMYLQYQQWKDTKYARGGLSKKGIDCSGLVYVTYLEKLGIELPRSTKLQSQIGKEIKRSELRSGDLVFFKISVKVRHVGIYIENGKFLHASTKEGVTISSLSDYYWKNKYWHSRRVDIESSLSFNVFWQST
jgi:cell wall-associated NlpC family hydrolase